MNALQCCLGQNRVNQLRLGENVLILSINKTLGAFLTEPYEPCILNSEHELF